MESEFGFDWVGVRVRVRRWGENSKQSRAQLTKMRGTDIRYVE